jgi:hypothetical protein
VPKKNPPGKTIWILWLQGWSNAPWYITKIKDSWVKYNPEWNVELVSESNISDYINIKLPQNASHAAISDIIRLNLLYTHGGVWVDSTLLCMMPLDLWIYEIMQPSGFWMYHGNPDEGPDAPASWFIISMKHNYIIKQWKEACNNYWIQNTGEHTYRWMDGLFMDLLDNDTKFKELWQNTPYLNCEDIGQSHMLAGKCMNNNKDLKEILNNKPPFAVKLSRHGVSDTETNEFQETNMYYAIECALNRTDPDFILSEITYRPIVNIITKEKVLVVADCNNGPEIIQLNNICKNNDIQIIVYDKCNFGKHVQSDLNIYCRPLKNVGREQSTYLYFISTYYIYLPEIIYLLPANIKKRPNRLAGFLNMIKDPEYIGECGTLNGTAEFILDEWEGVAQMPASIRPFKNWYEYYIGIWNNDDMGMCWNGYMQTNKKRIRRHTQEFYVRLYNDSNKYNNGEVGHYLERSMAAVF